MIYSGQGYAVRFFCDVVCGEFLFWFMVYCLIIIVYINNIQQIEICFLFFLQPWNEKTDVFAIDKTTTLRDHTGYNFQ